MEVWASDTLLEYSWNVGAYLTTQLNLWLVSKETMSFIPNIGVFWATEKNLHEVNHIYGICNGKMTYNGFAYQSFSEFQFTKCMLYWCYYLTNASSARTVTGNSALVTIFFMVLLLVGVQGTYFLL